MPLALEITAMTTRVGFVDWTPDASAARWFNSMPNDKYASGFDHSLVRFVPITDESMG